MSDTTITSAPETGAGTAETATPVSPTGTENAASENTSGDAGTSQGSSEGSQDNEGSKRWTPFSELKELRSQRREMREQVSDLRSQLEEMRQLRESANQPRSSQPERTPANFWQDPEAVLETKLQAIKNELRESITGEFHNVRQADQQNYALNQERGAAVEFIRSQKGYSPEDDEDLIEIINENGFGSLQPMQAARAAWAIYQQNRGVGDRSTLKRQASGVVGQPPGVGLGKKIWSQAEYDRTIDGLTPQSLTKELETELLAAMREGRVK